MYSLKIKIDTDGDFYYEKIQEFAEYCSDLSVVIYFEKRKDAIRILDKFVRTLGNTVQYGSRGIGKYAVDTIREFACKLYSTIRDKANTFIFDFDYGDQTLCIELVTVETEWIGNGKTYINCCPDIEFYSNDGIKAYLGMKE